MREIPPKVWHYVAAVAAGLVFVALAGLPLWPPTWWKAASIAVGVTAAIHLAWEHVLWRLGWVQRLTGRPNVSGTWQGTLRSQFHRNVVADPAAACSVATAEIPVFLVIRQTASHIKVRMLAERSSGTGELSSHYGDGTRAEAVVVYRNEPYQAGELIPHRGTSHYVFQKNGGRIDGRHWTDRFTRGSTEFTERVPEFADSFAEARTMFPRSLA